MDQEKQRYYLFKQKILNILAPFWSLEVFLLHTNNKRI